MNAPTLWESSRPNKPVWRACMPKQRGEWLKSEVMRDYLGCQTLGGRYIAEFSPSCSKQRIWWCWQCPDIGRQYGMKNKAAIGFQCKLNGELIAALIFILYSIWGYSRAAHLRFHNPCSRGVAGFVLKLGKPGCLSHMFYIYSISLKKSIKIL